MAPFSVTLNDLWTRYRQGHLSYFCLKVSVTYTLPVSGRKFRRSEGLLYDERNLLAMAKFIVINLQRLPLLTESARRVVHGEIGCSKWKKTLAYLLVPPGSRARIVRCGGRYDPQLVKRSSEWVNLQRLWMTVCVMDVCSLASVYGVCTATVIGRKQRSVMSEIFCSSRTDLKTEEVRQLAV